MVLATVDEHDEFSDFTGHGHGRFAFLGEDEWTVSDLQLETTWRLSGHQPGTLGD
jgi:hypothetical protein